MTIVTICLIAAILAATVYVFAAAITVSTLWKALVFFICAFVVIQVTYILVVYIASLFVKFEPLKKQKKFYRWAQVGISEVLITYPLVSAKLIGEEKMPKDTPFLFVCNHRSGFDPMVAMAKLKHYNISFISKPENMKIPLAGKTGYAAGALPIDRENNREALKTILQAVEYLKNGICNIGIYPEGTRSKSKEMLPFHAGSFKIAQKANVPVVIACCKGTENAKKNMFRRITKVTLEILEVVPAEKVVEMKTNDLAEYAQNVIAGGLGND